MMLNWTIDRWLTILGIVGSGLLSWIITRHYYRRSDKKRVPTFVLQSTSTLSESVLTRISGLKLTYDGEDIGKNGISDAKIYFWNSGTLPILQGEILEPYCISLPVRILAYSVLKSSRDVVGFSVSHEKSSDALILQFAVLEPGDGATLVFVFDGPRNTEIKFKGACLDAPKPTVLPPDPIYALPRFKRFGETYGRLLFVLGVPIVATLGLYGIQRIAHRLLGQRGEDIVSMSIGIGFGLLFAFVIVVVLSQHFKRMTAPYLPPDVKDK
jgi:hypothetical protein